MIDPTSYGKEQLTKLRTANKGIDPTLCEKMIRALGLLEKLAESKLDFVFKGGTSLILLVEKPERFSIDIDINTTESKETIENILEDIVRQGLFKHYHEKVREYRGIPKAHYYCYYDSELNGRENHVVLDVLFDEHYYPKVINTPIRSHWFKNMSETIYVKTPDIDSLLGDKLTVFAPNTTGIRYKKGKAMQIIKQLFDIDRLFDHIVDMGTVRESFQQIAAKELAYRKLKLSPQDVLNDILKTSLIVSTFPGKGKGDIPEMIELIDGMKRFKSYPINMKYRTDDAILSASKAAYLASILLNEQLEIKHYKDDIKLPELDFPNGYKHIMKLKRRLPEAHYYWHKAIELHNNIRRLYG